MRNRRHSNIWKQSAALFLALALFCTGTPRVSAANASANARTGETDLVSYDEGMDYSEYLAKYKDVPDAQDEYTMEAADYTGAEGMKAEVLNDYEGMDGKSILTEESGTVSWTVDIKKEGLYSLAVQYYPVEGKSSDIQRSVLIDGEVPFSEASSVEFSRLWVNESDEIQKDNQGNELKPRQVEKPGWNETGVSDADGIASDPFRFYFSEGRHTVSLESRREPMVIRRLRLYREKKVPSYGEVLAKYKEKGYKKAAGQTIVIQAEKAVLKSSPMLYPVTDRSSPAVEPEGSGRVRLNTVGGYNWREAGQWIEWTVEVPETGLYEIGVNAKQNWMKGLYVPRRLKVDGEVPFREMEELRFEFGTDWRQQLLGGDSPYLFYLTKGTHTLRMEAVLGKLSEFIRNVEESVTNLNDIYRRVVMLTGQDTDRWRDYQVAANIPGIAKDLKAEYDRLEATARAIESLTGKKSDKEAILLTMADQLKLFCEDVEKIPGRKDSFKTNIGALGTWLTQVREIPLQLDAVYLVPPGNGMPAVQNSLWDRITYQARLLFHSFTTDYNAIGNVADDKDKKTLTVWVGTGRDQANTMKSLIDESFTKETGISVNLMLVQMDTLLQATLAGQGPDVAMQVTNDVPMNYALRGAVADLTQFGDFPEVEKRFRQSAMVPFRFRGKCYALPETQTFSMMFYRKDILKELGLQIPETWDDVKAEMSVLSKNNMEFGMVPIPAVQQGSTAPSQTDLTYGMFLYQFGGQFYQEDGKASDLDSDVAVSAFKEWTKYYQDYTLTREFDFQNRFRTGETPIGIADYQVYNTLQVSAPEIKGLWDFTQVPGTRKEDGTVDHSVPSSGTSTVILQKAQDKESAWEFLKWWTSSEIQTRYGREMEGLQGPAARYPTANIEALQSLPWPVEDYRNLSRQFESVRGIPQVPGGYYTARNLTNAFAAVVIDKKIGPREALTDNVRYINDEIKNKRREFGLDS